MSNRIEQLPSEARSDQDRLPNVTARYNTVRRRWREILVTVVAAQTIAMLATFFLAPRYTATTQILFDPRKQNVFQLQTNAGVGLDIGSVESEGTLLQSFNVAERVVKQLGLEKYPDFAQSEDGLFTKIRRLFSSATPSVPTDSSLTNEQIYAIRTLRDAISVRRLGLTYVLEINVTAHDPRLSARLADTLAKSYLTEQLEARYDVAHRASDWFSDRLIELKSNLERSERAVAAYRKEHNLVDTQAGALDKQQISEISAQLVLARAQTAEKKAKYEQVERNRSSGNTAAVTEALQSPAISGLRAQESEVARKVADLSEKYSGQHPTLINARAELADVRRAIASEVSRITLNYKNEYDIADKREKSLAQSLAALTNISADTDEVKVRLNELDRDLRSNKSLYENFLNREKEAREQSSLNVNDSRVISRAMIPVAPSFPRRGLFALIASILGLIGGLSLAFLLDYLESGFVTAEQMEATTGYPVLAVLPAVGVDEYSIGDNKSLYDLVSIKPMSRFSEAVRSVRVGVSLSDVDDPPKVLLLTSSVPGEGKSTLTSSLATSAATSGGRILIMDCDLRHPSTTALFGLTGKPGLTEMLGGTHSASDVMLPITVANTTLYVIPAGGRTSNPPDLLGSLKLREFIESARSHFDLIICDTPPVTAVVDAAVLTKIVDKIIFVVQWKNTPRDVVARALNLLEDDKHRLAGLVINRADTKQMRYYSSYSSYYSYKYRGYYDISGTSEKA